MENMQREVNHQTSQRRIKNTIDPFLAIRHRLYVIAITARNMTVRKKWEKGDLNYKGEAWWLRVYQIKRASEERERDEYNPGPTSCIKR